ncbi:MAG: ABC transporter ATP-binding protein [Clostridiaceae bacterium]|jgi:putative spermidine/putrescine transport system ATP-binding protein|nr:ABC transporter ATP-binding protein [Clostridiaceae bacterium]
MEQNYIQINGICKTYTDGTRALKPISLAVPKGKVLVLLGPSGCGKSTLLRIIGGLEKPCGGSLFIDGQDNTRLSPEKRNIGFVFQQYALFPNMTVSGNICFGMKLQKKTAEEQKRKVENLLELMDIQNLRDKRPLQLSGGQQQRVALARALAIEPKVLLLDEPLTALDAQLRDKLRVELAVLFKKLNITTVYVTHDQSEAMAIADNIAVMNKGEIEQLGTPEEIYYTPQTPFVAQFVGQINNIGGIVDPRDIQSDGKTTLVYIRPEDILLVDKVHADYEGIVRESVFLGEKRRIVAEVGGQKLNIDKAGEIGIFPGETVYLKFNKERMIYLDPVR